MERLKYNFCEHNFGPDIEVIEFCFEAERNLKFYNSTAIHTGYMFSNGHKDSLITVIDSLKKAFLEKFPVSNDIKDDATSDVIVDELEKKFLQSKNNG
jgi:hypothetical protein